jgi:putative ABC transport system ATP-binding protein
MGAFEDLDSYEDLPGDQAGGDELMTGEPFIVCENLVKIYRLAIESRSSRGQLEVQALQGLDLTATQGEMVGVVGASGSGKSTLLNILGGLDRPTGGRAIVNRQDLGRMSSHELDVYRRETVGFVWQYGARNLVPYLTAVENVVLPVTLSGHFHKDTDDEAIKLLDLVGLVDRKDHRLEELSGGEQQRVAVAIALANKPRLLLADEPTGELDTVTAKTIYELLRSLNQRMGLTIVIVSHDPGIARHVDRVVAVRDGRLASETLRVKTEGKSQADAHAGEEHILEELVVLDSSGRLTIPHEILEHFQIRRRVRLEVLDEGILIKPSGNEPELETNVQKLDAPEPLDDVDDLHASRAFLDRPRKWLNLLKSKLPLHRFQGKRHEQGSGDEE